jgi:hypothetical protein
MSSARIVPVNFFDSEHSTVVISPAAASGFPETNLQSNVASDIWVSTSDANQVITGNFGGNARQISHFSVWPAPPDCLIGSQVRLRMWSDVAKTALVHDQTYDFFTFSGDTWNTFLWGIQQWGVDNADRTARLAPLVKWFAAVAVSAYEITFIRTGALEVHYFAARRIWLGDYVAAAVNASAGLTAGFMTGSSHHRNPTSGTLRRKPGARWRAMRFEMMFEEEAERAAWNDLNYVADPNNEIIFSIFQENTLRDRDTTLMGSLETLQPIAFQALNFNKLQFSIVES